MKLESINIECLIIGAGVAGLAIAKDISKTHKNTFVIEKNNFIGEEISSRNSEVIHAGIYYKKGSLKHKLISNGRDILYEYLENRNIPFYKCGKYIISSTSTETKKLNSIVQNAENCGVNDIYFDTEKFKIKYPFISVDQAIFSPSTGIIDSHQYMQTLRDDFEINGGHVLLNNELLDIKFNNNGMIEILVRDKNTQTNFFIKTKLVINCAGLYAADVHNLIFNQEIPIQKRLVKGDYYSYSGGEQINHLIYPIPEKDGLGVHVTIDMGRQIKFGPSAYEVDEINYNINEQGKEDFIKSIQKYWPKIDSALLQPSYSGIRPKIVDLDDFKVMKKTVSESIFLSVLGYESPGLTASLGLSKYIKKLL